LLIGYVKLKSVFLKVLGSELNILLLGLSLVNMVVPAFL